MGKFCSNCGNELKDGADVCLQCGKRLVSQNKIVPVKNDATILTVVIACVVAFFVFFFLCIFFPIIFAILFY